MSDNFFEGTTAAVGTIITIVLLSIVIYLIGWG